MLKHLRAFVESAAVSFELAGPIYEFGFCCPPAVSTGETLRGCFPETGYIGCDLTHGSEIDRMDDLVRLPFPDGAARTVVCINALEHVFEPQRAFAEMLRILAPGGMFLIGSTMSSDTPDDGSRYWEPTFRSLQRLTLPLEASLVGWQGADRFAHALYAVGCKSPAPGSFASGANRFIETFQRRLDQLASDVGPAERLGRLLRAWTGSKTERRRLRDYHKARFVLDLPAGEQFKNELLASYLSKKDTGSRLDLSQ